MLIENIYKSNNNATNSVISYLFFPRLHESKHYNLRKLPNKKRFSLYYCFDDNGDSHEDKTESPFFCLVTFYIEIPEYFC